MPKRTSIKTSIRNNILYHIENVKLKVLLQATKRLLKRLSVVQLLESEATSLKAKLFLRSVLNFVQTRFPSSSKVCAALVAQWITHSANITAIVVLILLCLTRNLIC